MNAPAVFEILLYLFSVLIGLMIFVRSLKNLGPSNVWLCQKKNMVHNWFKTKSFHTFDFRIQTHFLKSHLVIYIWFTMIYIWFTMSSMGFKWHQYFWVPDIPSTSAAARYMAQKFTPQMQVGIQAAMKNLNPRGGLMLKILLDFNNTF